MEKIQADDKRLGKEAIAKKKAEHGQTWMQKNRNYFEITSKLWNVTLKSMIDRYEQTLKMNKEGMMTNI